ncbi:hypothetical protein CBM2625_U90004 [Cupriavidus taiwanensis]|uniref:Uncharacterized protein n=1 Tax=Cupriavidus taiwanensis TaxID=164546 RepID=A0A375FJ87_9BURK|nr:hypothetical protein CBM2614_U90004 [Cupriavidus taiwanensis]SOZ75522.1 hypothetical protein CBM2613_U80004 [Cupriavidus taiwanensis]SPA13070.1 hypothetical protein CBM2625_U90004 [Cupriavidus taiwanensis]SPA57758.1 hypothetical protein CBM2638_U80004 [Cupriavidus taiwanensis]
MVSRPEADSNPNSRASCCPPLKWGNPSRSKLGENLFHHADLCAAYRSPSDQRRRTTMGEDMSTKGELLYHPINGTTKETSSIRLRNYLVGC